jgi:hypothetical protein
VIMPRRTGARNPRIRSVGELWLYLGGPIVWAAHFSLLYGIEAVICSGFGRSSLKSQFWLIALGLTAVALITLLCFIAWQLALRRRDYNATNKTDRSSFLRDMSIALVALAMIGVLWSTMPALVLPVCTTATG